MEHAQVHSEPFLFNHAVRSWLFAVRLGQLQDIPHDEEVVAVGSLLHDLGLTDSFAGERRFEVEGADAARTFGREQGLDDFARDFGERFVLGYKPQSSVDFLMNAPFQG